MYRSVHELNTCPHLEAASLARANSNASKYFHTHMHAHTHTHVFTRARAHTHTPTQQANNIHRTHQDHQGDIWRPTGSLGFEDFTMHSETSQMVRLSMQWAATKKWNWGAIQVAKTFHVAQVLQDLSELVESESPQSGPKTANSCANWDVRCNVKLCRVL